MEGLAELTVSQLLGGGIGIIALLSIFIEIVPVKFCPVSSALKWLGRKLNGELFQKVTELTGDLANLDEKVNSQIMMDDERNAINHRVRILAFGDELRHGLNHSKESYDQVLMEIDQYNCYCREHPDFKNNRTSATTSIILKSYEECIEKNSFL